MIKQENEKLSREAVLQSYKQQQLRAAHDDSERERQHKERQGNRQRQHEERQSDRDRKHREDMEKMSIQLAEVKLQEEM